MWTGELTDTFYDDTFSLVCYKHRELKHEVKHKEKIEKMLRETFTVMKLKCMSFVLEDECTYHGELFREWLCEKKLFEKKFFHKHEEKVNQKDAILLIDSVSTFTLALFSKMCCICTKITSINDLKIYREKQELFQSPNDEFKCFDYTLFPALTHPHYPKVKSQFSSYSTDLVNFAFVIACHTFASTFGTDTKEFWDRIVETPAYHQFKHRGNEAYNNKDYDSAFDIYLDALKHYPYSFHLFGNCAQVSLTLHKYKSAELLSRFALIINPQWCKAYYKLATALFQQKKIHKAHLVASMGMGQCQLSTCSERDTLEEYSTTVIADCTECMEKLEQNADLKSEKKMEVKPTYDLEDSDDSDGPGIPDLTDTTDHGSSETDSMSDIDLDEMVVFCNNKANNDEVLNLPDPVDQIDVSENEVSTSSSDEVEKNDDAASNVSLQQDDIEGDVSNSPITEIPIQEHILLNEANVQLPIQDHILLGEASVQNEHKEMTLGSGEIVNAIESVDLNCDIEPELNEECCKGTELELKQSKKLNSPTKEDLQSRVVLCNEDSLSAEELNPGVIKMIRDNQKGNFKLEDIAKLVPNTWPRFVNLMNRYGVLLLDRGIIDEEHYKLFIQFIEPFKIGFIFINDLQDIAMARQEIQSFEPLSIEQHDSIRVVIEKERAFREKLDDLEELTISLENAVTTVSSADVEKCRLNSANINRLQIESSSTGKCKSIPTEEIIEAIIRTHGKYGTLPKPDSSICVFEIDMKKLKPVGNSCKPKSDEIPASVGETSSTDQNTSKYRDCKISGDFENALTEGSSAVKMGLMSLAMLHFSQALDMVQQVPELCEDRKVNAVAVKFVYGFACYKCYSFESMNRAITTFKEIINREKEHLAPVYYLMGLSFIKFHKFQVALTYLKNVASMAEEDFNFNVCNLLDENCIKEIKYENIQESLKDEISKCECPPPPDALCKYKSCILDSAIYFEDLSFKKFMCVRCQERCVLQYHVTCWKAIKESFSKTDKEFLDCPCFTPDCSGLIIKVEMVGKDGVLERDFTSEGNYKLKRCVKQKKTKLEKKQEQKQRKRQQNRSRTASENLGVLVDDPEAVIENTQSNELNPTECQSPIKVKKNCTEDTHGAADEESKVGFGIPVNIEPMYIIRKDANEKECEYKHSKHKERKKPKKSVLTIDEFCEGCPPANVTSWTDYQLRLHRLQESKRVVEEQATPVKWNDGCDDTMSYVPVSYDVPDSFEISNEIETALDSSKVHNDYYETDENELRATINLHFNKFLQKHRTVKVTDPVLLHEITKLSKKARDLIDRKGGFLPFLQGSEEFAVVNGDLCHFSDMMNLYLPPIDNVMDQCSSNEVLENISMSGDHISKLNISSISENSNIYHYMDMNELCGSKNIEELDDFTDRYATNEALDNISICEDSKPNEIVTVLNPNAEEYNPSRENSSEDSHSSQEALKNGLACESLKINNNSFLSRVAGMRQELKSYSVVEADKVTPECSELETSKPIIENVPDVQQQEKDLQEKTETDYPFFVDYFHSHFDALIKDGEKNKIHKAYQCLKFLMQQLGKTNGFLVDATEQIGTSNAVSLISQGVMKEDAEFVQLTVESKILRNINKKITAHSTSLEELLTEALDKQTEFQNKYQVETASLKKELEENQSTFQESMQTLKKKLSTLEKELKLWRQKHNQQMDKEKVSHTENEVLQMKSKNLTNKVSELEKERNNLKMELQLKINSNSEIINGYEKELQREINEKNKAQADVFPAKEGLKNAELQILNIKKAEYLKAFGVTLTRVNSNIQELKDGIQRMENMNPVVRNTLKTLQGRLNEYIRDMHSTRLRFVGDIADQIKQVESGISLSVLPELQIPTFSALPTLDTILDKVPPEQSLPGSMVASERQQQVPVNSFRSSDQQPQNSFTDFSSRVLHQNFQKPMPWSTNPATGIGLIKPPLPSQPISQLAMQSQQNSFFPNLNSPIFSGYQPPRTSPTLQTMPSISSQVSHAPIGSQLTSSKPLIESQLPTTPPIVTDSFTSNFATAFNQKVPPGLGSQPSSSTNSIASFTSEFEQKHPPLLTENKELKNSVSSLISPNDAASLSQAINLPYESLAPGHSFDDKNSNSNKSLTFSNTVKKTVSNGGFVTVENTKKAHHQADDALLLELGYSSTRPPSVADVSKPSSQSSTEADSAVEGTVLKGAYRKIVNRLKIDFPNMTNGEVMSYIREYRTEKGGALSNLPFTTIISDMKIILHAKKQKVLNLVAYPINRPKTLVNKTLTSCSTPAPPPPIPKKTTAPAAPWAKTPDPREKVPQTSFTSPSEKSCAICLEEMTSQTAKKMDCGHPFHFICIKLWLNKQSNCPVCRVHLLLPEDFPSLP